MKLFESIGVFLVRNVIQFGKRQEYCDLSFTHLQYKMNHNIVKSWVQSMESHYIEISH